ncbi:alpha/beta hydrolase [Streptomyces spectabilis]|uniref:Alpha/beta hydrolase n=1 Tax=Streptomyces spectabilis TaxID=68270 RepID=A0A5P2X3P3_STRST|nr:alpha/beta hydrolase [Streptomyces spectabilis]MBB5107329.1 pimeloyl-ACP methyl ester carboxylesterase [Streptomyces spectabilis]MCI3900020.1 alpha/beta hydrolase [Streptomyces spectabilis]QEV57650.1 alpha/beta hydrolase [Streptomyces spectabilis]GGV36895.1 peptidase [Streptomyces spectabilis]
MPHPIRPGRTAVLAAASLFAIPALAGCGGGSDDADKGERTATATPSAGGATGGAVGGTGEGKSALPAALSGQRLSWSSCPAPSAAQGTAKAPGKGWECATMKAPLDYAKPKGETVGVALIRKKATDADRRIGSLVYNFGGPGASGVATLPQAAEDYTKLNASYDLVSFDPRGVGNTTTVKCLDDKTLDTDPGSGDALKDIKRHTRACVKNSAKVLPHVGTATTARDMDLMRQVLGDKKLNYFGISYGTELGGVYAHLFPKNVGRTVFDAVVDPTRDPVRSGLAQAKAFQKALESAMAYCAEEYAENCPTGKTAAEGNRRINAMLAELDKKPAPTESDRKLTKDLALTAIGATLYEGEEGWDILAPSLAEVMGDDGTGTSLLMIADLYNGRDDKGRYSNMHAANGAITCADTRSRHSRADVDAERPAFEKASPVFGPSMVEGLLGCSQWPVRGTADKPEVSAPGAAPIVVVGNTGDPATPVEGARRMARQLGKGVGVNLTVDGEGHGTYGDNRCATKAIDTFLINGKAPADGTVCK